MGVQNRFKYVDVLSLSLIFVLVTGHVRFNFLLRMGMYIHDTKCRVSNKQALINAVQISFLNKETRENLIEDIL